MDASTATWLSLQYLNNSMREFFLGWAMELEIKSNPDFIVSVVEIDGTPIMGFHPKSDVDGYIRLTAKPEAP